MIVTSHGRCEHGGFVTTRVNLKSSCLLRTRKFDLISVSTQKEASHVVPGKEWRSHRRLLQPSFHQGVLEMFLTAFHDGSRRLVHRFKNTSSPVNITRHMNETVLEILNDTVLGVQVGDTTKLRADENSPFRHAKVLVPYRLSHPWLMIGSIYSITNFARNELSHKKSLFDFTRKVIRDKKEERNKTKDLDKNWDDCAPARMCLLDRMLDISEEHQEFDEDAIIHEVCTFMLAGQESVATALAFLLILLAKHPDILTKVRREAEEILGNSKRAPTLVELQDMKYLEQCIKETLRLYPSIPVLGRKLSEDVVMGKHTLPAGCNVLIAPYATHRIPDLYPDPEKFDPDRFLPEKIQERHPYAYIAFSSGPRNCIGYKFAILELKTLASALVREYDMTVVPGKEDINIAYRITLRAKGGLWLRFTPRAS
uniref:Cytochrome P450 n=1 Tax=Timema cristinae TaxID=61476 RepID=A0A7R9DB55_TIMCR|nr:unnamed protein product [Timema cristinae]